MQDAIQVRSNLRITVRERGKIVARREGHNIFLNLGREWLARLICYSSFGPNVAEDDNRIRYMGFGIGGFKQSALAAANSAPYVTAYPGSNADTDTDPTLTRLERPVRISGGSTAYPGVGTDVWLGQVQAPVVHNTATSSQFKHLFDTSDVSYSPFTAVPLSEIALFTNAANPLVYNNTAVAYDTFDTVTKTIAFQFEMDWELRF